MSMEEKLIKTAELLPVPVLEFEAIEQAVKKQQKLVRKPRTIMRVALAVLLIVCLCTTAFAYGKVKYGLWSGLHSKGYGDVVLLNWKYDYNFPEEFLGIPFSSMSTLYGAPQGATHLEALLKPTYTLHSVAYGEHSGTVQEDGTVIYTGQRIRIGLGSNQGENWKYHFSVDEDGFCNHEGVIPESQRKTEYDGYVLYVCSYAESHHVRWEDGGRQMILRLIGYGFETQDEVVEIAKELIDMNQ